MQKWAESTEQRAWARRGRTTGGSPYVRVSDPNQEWSSLRPPGKREGTRACTGRGFRRQTRPGRPEGKNFYTLPPAKALRREGRPVRPWREAHSLSPCPVGQRLRLRTRKTDPIARVLHPRSDNTRCCPADSSWACPPGSRRIDVYSYKVPARPEAKSALITTSRLRPSVPWDCCWVRNWQCCINGHLREGRRPAFSVLPVLHSGILSGFSAIYGTTLLPEPAPDLRSSIL